MAQAKRYVTFLRVVNVGGPQLRLLIIVLCSVLTGWLPACRSGDDYGDTVRAMTFNIFHDRASPPDDLNIPGWPGRRQLVAETIRRERPDIVGLQEALLWQVEWLVSQLPEYGFVGRGRNAAGDGESVAILYRKDKFDVLDSGDFWFSDTPQVPGSISEQGWGTMTYPRMTSWARLRNREVGRSFYAYNTHLASDGSGGIPSRDRSVKMLAERIASRAHPKEPFVITGDFNANESDFAIAFLTGAVPGAPVRTVDAWRTKPNGPAGTRCSNIAGADAGLRIDYILAGCTAKGCGDVLDAGAILHGDACASDHRAVTATIRLLGRPVRP